MGVRQAHTASIRGIEGLSDGLRSGECIGVELLGRLGAPVASFRADGAYDTRAVYAALDEVGMPGTDFAIPRRRTASSSRPGVGTWRHREAALRRIDDVGRRPWRKESGANQQARAENGMVRFKQILADRLRSRSEDVQQREAMIGMNILNHQRPAGASQAPGSNEKVCDTVTVPPSSGAGKRMR